MAKQKISFTVTPSDGIDNFWIAVSEHNVPLGTNNKGAVDLEENRSYILLWFMVGNSGQGISIVGEIIDESGMKNKVVEVKKSKIPAGEFEAANHKRFAL
jgi:hypothetical protein